MLHGGERFNSRSMRAAKVVIVSSWSQQGVWLTYHSVAEWRNPVSLTFVLRLSRTYNNQITLDPVLQPRRVTI